MDRRTFIEKMSLLSISGIAGASLVGMAGCKAPASLYTKSIFEGNTVRVVKTDFPTKDNYTLIQHPTDEHPIYIHKEGNDYLALHMKCTHKGCTVKAGVTELKCPCHGSLFDNKGNVTKGPAQKPLMRYKTTSDASNIYIEIL